MLWLKLIHFSKRGHSCDKFTLKRAIKCVWLSDCYQGMWKRHTRPLKSILVRVILAAWCNKVRYFACDVHFGLFSILKFVDFPIYIRLLALLEWMQSASTTANIPMRFIWARKIIIHLFIYSLMYPINQTGNQTVISHSHSIVFLSAILSGEQVRIPKPS